MKPAQAETPDAAPPPRSLRWRLLVATFAAQAVALALAGWAIDALFREHVQRQFDAGLVTQLDQVTARLEPGSGGEPKLAAEGLSDPRWLRPFSGLYWQVDEAGATRRTGVLRSRSLWDTVIPAPRDELAVGELHLHDAVGPAGAPLRVAERTVQLPQASGASTWRLLVAADRTEIEAAITRFQGALGGSLLILLGLLAAAAAVQVKVGLQPLEALRRTLRDLREGRSTRLEGRFPSEVQPLVEDFNTVLDQHASGLQRSRAQAGNLAHAVKTPLAVLAQAAAQAPDPAEGLARLVAEQVEIARRQVDWHLARSRAAAARGTVGLRCEVEPVVDSLLRVLQRVHGNRSELAVRAHVDPGLAFAGEEQDLQEMLGNLLDNAFRFAAGGLEVNARALTPDAAGLQALLVTVDDDGPGIDRDRREQALARGQRLDESTPGSGLGLAIVQELAGLYGGSLELAASPRGGLRAALRLPRALSRVSPANGPPAPAAPAPAPTREPAAPR